MRRTRACEGGLIADGLVVNDGKGVVLSNMTSCGREAMQRCRALPRKLRRSARNLGVDYACGRRAGVSTQAKRAATVLRRAARIRVLHAARGETRKMVSLGLTQLTRGVTG